MEPWIEKYRPKKLDEILGNTRDVENLKRMVEQGSMPNIIISGSSGSGKTSSIMCLCEELLGSYKKEAVLELNASDNRGIDVVRNKIRLFAQKKINLPEGRHKIVILDEADNMTKDAQSALRQIIENYEKNTRFAISCNLSSKIIEQIQSRFVIMRYTRLTDKQVLEKLRQICTIENVPFTKEGLEAILFTSEGDLRNAINNLQATFNGFSEITDENVYKVCDKPHPTVVQQIIQKTLDEKGLNEATKILVNLYNEGYASIDIVGTFFKVVRDSNDFPSDKVKYMYIKEISTTHMLVLEGLDSLNQLTGLLARFVSKN
jgi:replication factor C subunit 2/4